MMRTQVYAQAPASFSHPGVFSSNDELVAVKEAVTNQSDDPRVAGYEKLASVSIGSLNYLPTPYAEVHVVASGVNDEERAFRQDAHALYIHAIKWVVTGDAAHKDKAIEIADAWGEKFEGLVAEEGKPNQPTLEASWAAPIWLAGAEILKYYNQGESKWNSSSFDGFITKVLTYVNGPIYQTANWLISKDLSLMAAGVYFNDADMYNQGYNHVVGQINTVTTSGDIPELMRDFVHSQYVLIGMAQCAEIAYQQGDSGLFTLSDSRLRTGAESYVLSVLSVKSPAYYSESVWARKSAPYEILLNRYTALGLDVPNVRYYVISQNRVEDGSEDHFVGWLTATHAIKAEAGDAPVNEEIQDVPGNIAFGATASASSEPQPENPASSAIDNNPNTRWSASEFPQWLEVDLGEIKVIGKTEVICYSDRAYQFTISTRKSENEDYTQIVDRSGNTEPGTNDLPITNEFNGIEARYIKLNITGASAYTGPWASITEFRIYEGDLSQNVLNSAKNHGLKIYPNPSEDTLMIDFPAEQIETVKIQSLTGKTIRENSKVNRLDISDLRSGVYLVNIQLGTTTQTYKFVKK